MTKKLMLSFILAILINLASAQTITHLYVVAKAGSPLPSCPTCSTSTNGTVNTLFANAGVTEYKRSFPGAISARLNNTYQIKGTGNLVSLKNSLMAGNYFDLVEESFDWEPLGSGGGCTTPVTINDPYIIHGWTTDKTLEMEDAYCAWTITTGNPNIKIAVLDENIDPNHPEYAGKVTVMNPSINGIDGIITHDSHGMRAAGVICAQPNNNDGTAAIGYNLRVNSWGMPFRFHGLRDQYIWEAYQAGSKVLNMSLRGPWSTTSAELMREAAQGGMVSVVAAGNSQMDNNSTSALWNIPGVIIVSGVGQDNRHGSAIYSGNRHSENVGVDLCAVSIGTSTVDVSNGSYVVVDGWGTSFAAPQVAATIGLMLSINPCLSPVEIEAILKSTTDPIDDASLFVGKIGTGRLNVYKAVLKAQQWGNATLTVNSGETVDLNVLDHYKFITVKGGGTLNINAIPLYIAKDGRIRVEAGGKLNITGTTLMAKEPTPSCNFARYQWEGIFVEGNPSLDQLPLTNQGQLNIVAATIQDAKNAISTRAIDPATGATVWSKTGGGIVKASYSTFRKSGRHMEFMFYQRPGKINDLSNFNDCTFEADGSIDVTGGVNTPVRMVTANGVRGVRFIGCSFKNTNGSQNANIFGYNRGIGIYALDAQLIVEDKRHALSCVSTKRGAFYDLSTGFQSSFSPSVTVGHRVKKQDFTRTDRGVWLSNGVGSAIDHNIFNLYVPNNYYNRQYSVSDPLYQTGIVGIYAPKSAGYRLEENAFSMTGTKIPTEVIIAMVMDFSDANGGGGYFRRNTVDNDNVGTQTQDHNQSTMVACNDYKNTVVGIRMNLLTPSSRTPSFGQCSRFNSDLNTNYKNTFQTNSTDVYKQAAPMPYLVTNTDPLKPTIGYNVAFADCAGAPLYIPVTSFNCTPFNELLEPCSKVSKPLTDYKGTFQTKKNTFKTVWDDWQDGGNQQLITMIIQGPSIPANTIYAELIGRSPYLTNSALTSMLQYSTHLTEQQRVDVLVANASLSSMVMTAVNTHGFSSGALAQIAAANVANMPRIEENQALLDLVYADMVNAKNDVILSANAMGMSDSLHNYVDSIIAFLQPETDIDSRKQLIGTFYAAGMYDQASQYLTTLQSDQTTETAKFIQYYTLLLNAKEQGRNIYTLTQEEWNQLTAIAATGTAAAEGAKGILSLVKGQVFPAHIERLNDGGVASKRSTTGFSDPIQMQGADIKVFPNPASSSVSISYMLNTYKDRVTVNIVDIAGRTIYSQEVNSIQANLAVETERWNSGMYFVRVVSGTETLGVQKLMIQR